MHLNELGAAEAATGIRRKLFSAFELTSACLDQIARWDGSVHAWTHIDRTDALKQARLVDDAFATGATAGELLGVPVGIKDIFNTLDMPTQMGSPIWKGFTPGNDARVVHYLRLASAVILGKTVTAEFAVHAPGPTENPHRSGYIPGTSSSGSAAAVAAYMVPMAMGTQTAGSIIRPASYCGVFGFKPSFGLVPRTGMLKTTDSLDTVGWFARNVDDIALLFETVRVRGLDYPISEVALNDSARQTKTSNAPWRIASIQGPMWDCAAPYVREAAVKFAKRLEATGRVVIDQLPAPKELASAHETHGTIYDRALAYYFKEEFRHQTLVSSCIYEIVERGNLITIDQYQRALGRQREIAKSMEQLFLRGYDAVLDMATASAAMPGLDTVDVPDHALIWTLCGLPAVSLPVATSPDGLPVGVQLVARRYNDRLLLNLLRFLDRHNLVPRRTFPEPPMAHPTDHPISEYVST